MQFSVLSYHESWLKSISCGSFEKDFCNLLHFSSPESDIISYRLTLPPGSFATIADWKGVAFRDTLLKYSDFFWFKCKFLLFSYEKVLLSRFPTAQANLSLAVNDVNSGSPSRMRRVRRISFGMTILPRSSTRRTIPVAFIVFLSLCCISSGIVCRKWGIMREDSHAQTYNGFFVDKQRFSLEITKRPIYTIIGNV